MILDHQELGTLNLFLLKNWPFPPRCLSETFSVCKSNIGCTPLNYLLKIRLYHASKMLIFSDVTINEIALSCDFYDSNYFCKKFKANNKISPRQFRLKMGEKTP